MGLPIYKTTPTPCDRSQHLLFFIWLVFFITPSSTFILFFTLGLFPLVLFFGLSCFWQASTNFHTFSLSFFFASSPWSLIDHTPWPNTGYAVITDLLPLASHLGPTLWPLASHLGPTLWPLAPHLGPTLWPYKCIKIKRLWSLGAE